MRTRLYFTSESHLHSILTCLQYGGLADAVTDEQWKRAMDYVSTVPELNYLSQVVIMIYEDPTVVSSDFSLVFEFLFGADQIRQ